MISSIFPVPLNRGGSLIFRGVFQIIGDIRIHVAQFYYLIFMHNKYCYINIMLYIYIYIYI